MPPSGLREFMLDEASAYMGAHRFTCPTCHAKPRMRCTRHGRHVYTHKARAALWRAWEHEAPARLAWLEARTLPILIHVVEEYLAAGKRPNRRRTDIALARRAIEEWRATTPEQKP